VSRLRSFIFLRSLALWYISDSHRNNYNPRQAQNNNTQGNNNNNNKKNNNPPLDEGEDAGGF
jgi:hypothetical protein